MDPAKGKITTEKTGQSKEPSGKEGRSRAPLACTFCRRRKMRCSNDRPRCMNCSAFNEDCIYDEISKKLSSKSRISRLENENRRLQTRLANVIDTPSIRAATMPSSPTSSTSSSDVKQSSNDMIRFNGPSSAPNISSRIDGGRRSVHSRHQSGEHQYPIHGTPSLDQISTAFAALPDAEWQKRQLMAEAARQRDLERVNLESDRLDFDGVDPELGMHLLSLHWNRQHHSFLVTYRPAFMRDMACGGPYFSKLLLNAIYFGASKFSPRIEVQTEQYRQRVRSLLAVSMDRSEITTVQALLIITCSQFALGEERSAAWLNAGIAYRMIIDLGIHVAHDVSQTHREYQPSIEDLEIRRRVFWAAFVVDKIQSLYQGRPVSLQAMNCQVPMTFLDQYEEEENWKPLGFSGSAYLGTPTHSVSTFTNLCKLSVIMNSISNEVYPKQYVERETLTKDISSLHAELEHWHKALPNHLKFDPSDCVPVIPPPHVLSLLATYHVLLIQLHYPFIADARLHAQSPGTASESFTVCATAARKIVQLLRVYDRTFSIRKAPYLISYVAYVSATVLVRIAAQSPVGSEAHEYLRTSVAVLRENQATNWGVKNAMMVIVEQMKRMGLTDGNDQALLEAVHNDHLPLSMNSPSAAQPVLTSQPSMSMNSPLLISQDTRHAGLNEVDFNIDMIFQDFTGELTSETHTSTSDGSAYFLSPVTHSLDPHLWDSNAQEQMLSDPSAPVGFGATVGIGPNPLEDYQSNKQFY